MVPAQSSLSEHEAKWFMRIVPQRDGGWSTFVQYSRSSFERSNDRNGGEGKGDLSPFVIINEVVYACLSIFDPRLLLRPFNGLLQEAAIRFVHHDEELRNTREDKLRNVRSMG